ncbi:MAG: hypothetical protein IH899_10110 [Planctomycetes bacterium]|nr:hypothetical protein [Planctomycetota bacterium]
MSYRKIGDRWEVKLILGVDTVEQRMCDTEDQAKALDNVSGINDRIVNEMPCTLHELDEAIITLQQNGITSPSPLYHRFKSKAEELRESES